MALVTFTCNGKKVLAESPVRWKTLAQRFEELGCKSAFNEYTYICDTEGAEIYFVNSSGAKHFSDVFKEKTEEGWRI